MADYSPYLPLNIDLDEVRLFSFDADQPYDCAIDTPLNITFHTVSLSSGPQYRALSYFWGNEHTGAVFCNGSKIEITQNCLTALHRLRTRSIDDNIDPSSFDTEKVYFWVDAICINQSNNDEKAGQMKLMGRIYSNAMEALAYIGEPLTKGRDLKLLDIIEDKSRGEDGQSEQSEAGRANHGELSPGKDESPRDGDSEWKAVAELFIRPWFCRTWTLQEAVLPEALCCIFGEAVFAFENIETLAPIWRELTTIEMFGRRWEGKDSWAFGRSLTMKQCCNLSISNYETAYMIRKGWWCGQLVAGIDVLQANRHRRCKDARDQIFAFLSFMSDIERAEFAPRFTDSLRSLFSSVSSYYAKYGEALKLLHFSSNSEFVNLADTPSWAPDWHNQLIGKPLSFRLYHCATRAKESTSLSADEQILQVRGFIVDDVQFATGWIVPDGEYYDIEDEGCNIKHVLDLIYKKIALFEMPECPYLDEMRACYGGEQARKEAVWRALVASSDGRDGRPTAQQRQEYNAFIEWAALGPYVDIDFRLANLERNLEIHSSFLKRFLDIQAYRKITITKAGRIGTIPSDFKHGDKIAVMLGAPTPLIIRPSKGSTTLTVVGPCYLDGIMENELFKEDGNLVNPDLYETEDFQIA
ncbi:hypothetical protein OIDMADRAFT_57916 [Oidiodendron maius Zn]|uniref:Heterokaryon incompatibility domain-containing protein n=1 Tax=Oidiodendron maius (strain Zn) TaxID=913774 RepID=A0A0C3CED6_OIDMZ|nr:hypothetical protein OIDMADRAFT_57916 [Oidiodendron maius Zn]